MSKPKRIEKRTSHPLLISYNNTVINLFGDKSLGMSFTVSTMPIGVGFVMGIKIHCGDSSVFRKFFNDFSYF